MKLFAALFLILVAADAPRPEPAIIYFTNVREVQISQSDRQNYFIVDQELWDHSRADLGDLRIYDGTSPVQYALNEQLAGMSSEEVEAKLLNLGSVAGHTEFDVDTQSLPEYDRIRLRLDAHDFVVTASISGGSAPGGATEVQLPPSTLYDFTKEQLGSNSQIKLPTSSFRYLHVKLSAGIRPDQVKGATIYNVHEQQAAWTKFGTCGAPQQKQHDTVISCDVSEKIPVTRLLLHVEPSQVNFRRTVSLENSKGEQIASGEVSRVRMNRAGTLVTSEELALTVSGTPGPITLKIDNGENPPLAITGVDPLAIERRVYFDPQGKSKLALYYGDVQLSSPAYDYARFFHVDTSPAQAELGQGEHNPQYKRRPESRPWSEQHPALLWTVMLVTVLILAFLALRGLRTGTAR